MQFPSIPSAQAQPTSTSEMRRVSPEQRNTPGARVARAACGAPSGGVATAEASAEPTGGSAIDRKSPWGSATARSAPSLQLTVQDCISLAERECLEPPCESQADCDHAGECLGFWAPDGPPDPLREAEEASEGF